MLFMEHSQDPDNELDVSNTWRKRENHGETKNVKDLLKKENIYTFDYKGKEEDGKKVLEGCCHCILAKEEPW